MLVSAVILVASLHNCESRMRVTNWTGPLRGDLDDAEHDR